MNNERNNFYAHSANADGKFHSLAEHLDSVASMASEFCESYCDGTESAEIAFYAGLWHDVGKFNSEFQAYLRGELPRGPDHKAAGVKVALQKCQPVGLIVQGHHGGLQALKQLSGWLAEKDSDPATEKALEHARQVIPGLEPEKPLTIPKSVRSSELKSELWLRMVFSALVDADYLDTEKHFESVKSEVRHVEADIPLLWRRFQAEYRSQTADATGVVNDFRARVFSECLNGAKRPRGIFKLSAPTGSGKTMAGLGFALRHAAEHGMQRVIVAVPFTSITEQTASTYRSLLECDTNEENRVVLEHHSMFDEQEQAESQTETWNKLASENWDAPIVVTTTVQLFNSLFSNMPRNTRKLHNLANSVIILDEVQTLPSKLLEPILDALKSLVEDYDSTVVLSTATQPAFDAIKTFKDLDAIELVPASLIQSPVWRRVNYRWKIDTPWTWDRAANEMRKYRQSLAIVNTKAAALSLLTAIDDEDIMHLSTLLCGKHRLDVVREVRRRLDNGEDCRVVSTQVVEAGVDFDFPLVLRALGPLDSIVQAAGRCNRGGNWEQGEVVIFQPAEDAGLPPGQYKSATELTRIKFNAGSLDLHSYQAIEDYFHELFSTADLDAVEVQAKRRDFDYPEVSRRFRMIEDNTVSAVITNYGDDEDMDMVSEYIEMLSNGIGNPRQSLRRIQPWTVPIFERQLPQFLQDGLLSEIVPGLYEWCGNYDERIGIGGATAIDAAHLVV